MQDGLDHAEVAAYLARIGADRSPAADLAALRELHVRHLATVPFENLDIHLGVPIELDVPALFDKIVRRHRGGFCYELDGAFAALLAALGFEVTLLSARVFGPDGRLGPPFDHLALRVELDEPWLADVGFGRHSSYPLRLAARGEQTDPGGTFVLAERACGDLDVLRDGQPEYRVDLRPRELGDFEPTCWWQQTSPASHFTRSTTCSLPTATGQLTLSGRKLIRTDHGERRVTVLESDVDVLAAYRDHFGVVLDRVPEPSPLPTAVGGGE